MNIKKTGPERRGTLDQGVGSLVLKGEDSIECAILGIFATELEVNPRFWAKLMFALQSKNATDAEMKVIQGIVDRVSDELKRTFEDVK